MATLLINKRKLFSLNVFYFLRFYATHFVYMLSPSIVVASNFGMDSIVTTATMLLSITAMFFYAWTKSKQPNFVVLIYIFFIGSEIANMYDFMALDVLLTITATALLLVKLYMARHINAASILKSLYA